MSKTTLSKIESEVKDFRDLLLENGLVIAANPLTVKSVGAIRRVTWQSPNTAGALTSNEFASLREYSSQLASNSYTVLLFDGAILQISFDVLRNKIVGHRLCFFPCPFEVRPSELLESPILDIIELYEQAGLEHLRLRTPLRFEYDRNNAGENHPLSHAHMLWAHCRCAVVGPISLGHFIKFVFSHFYPKVWEKYSFLREWPTDLGVRTISIEQEGFLHFSCRR